MSKFCLRVITGPFACAASAQVQADGPRTPREARPGGGASAKGLALSKAFSIVWIAVLLLTACGGKKPEAAEAERPQKTIQTAPVEFRSVSAELIIPASVQPDPARVVHVFAPVSGRLLELRVKPGDEVRSGQPVALVQSSDVSSARSDFEKAKAQAHRSESALNRVTLLFQHGAVAEKDLEDARAQAAQDASELARAQEKLHLLGLNETQPSDRATVAAPRAGVVTETTSAPGEFAKSLDASSPLLTIADLSSVWVVGSVYERDLAAVPSGLSVRITAEAYPAETWQGKISNISAVVDAATHTVKLRVVLENRRHELKPDMFATIHVQRPASRVAVVPSAAVLHEGNEAFVMVQSGGSTGKFEKRTVEIQQSGPQETLVRSGLQPGDVIVSSGAELLREEEAAK
jgi:membrane fusion protein, heavy metal efflux system